jgi:hypothetical protein
MKWYLILLPMVALGALVLILTVFKKQLFEGFSTYLGFSTKCFSCEKDMIKRGLPTYLAHPTKCVDCDVQMAKLYGSDAGHFGQNNKCLDCEPPNPLRHL